MDADKQACNPERRQATVLFADISGFTSMSEKLDPEEVMYLMNACFACLEAAVCAHGGVVDKYLGDCIMALFGVPLTLENAPRQAIKAAIEMRSRIDELNRERRLPLPLSVHIGIDSGLVIAGDVGGQVKRDFTVIGGTVNRASRLKDASSSGQIWVGPDTYRCTKDEFLYKELHPIVLKGKEEPISGFELLSGGERVNQSTVPRRERMIFPALVATTLKGIGKSLGNFVQLSGRGAPV